MCWQQGTPHGMIEAQGMAAQYTRAEASPVKARGWARDKQPLQDAASLVQSPTRQPSSTAMPEGWSDEVNTSPETTHILQMLDSSPSQGTIIALHE